MTNQYAKDNSNIKDLKDNKPPRDMKPASLSVALESYNPHRNHGKDKKG